MALQYTVIEKQKLDEHGNAMHTYQAQIVSKGKLSFAQIKREAANRYGIPAIQIAQVYNCITEIIEQKLIDGYVIELEDLGTMHLTLESLSEKDANKINSTSITNAHVHFRANDKLKFKLRNVKLFIKQK
jgi:predicted histone-like DNA-binding protein